MPHAFTTNGTKIVIKTDITDTGTFDMNAIFSLDFTESAKAMSELSILVANASIEKSQAKANKEYAFSKIYSQHSNDKNADGKKLTETAIESIVKADDSFRNAERICAMADENYNILKSHYELGLKFLENFGK
jgi:hypothetical protein